MRGNKGPGHPQERLGRSLHEAAERLGANRPNRGKCSFLEISPTRIHLHRAFRTLGSWAPGPMRGPSSPPGQEALWLRCTGGWYPSLAPSLAQRLPLPLWGLQQPLGERARRPFSNELCWDQAEFVWTPRSEDVLPSEPPARGFPLETAQPQPSVSRNEHQGSSLSLF